MKSTEFVKKLKDVATKYKTLYVIGCFGSPMTASNKVRYSNNYAYNKQAHRTRMIQEATSDTFGFDCVCLIKGILWGWSGKKTSTYGGAVYASNNVPDLSANAMFKKCTNVSTDFSKIEVGEAVWMDGHIGVYVGDGLAVECTPSWKNCVQLTACNRDKSGYNRRNWTKHGKLPYIEYPAVTTTTTTTSTSTTAKKSIAVIAQEVLDGKWYNGAARRSALTKAGYNYDEVQAEVNRILSGKKSVAVIAQEVLDGKWYNGAARRSALTKAGYNYDEVQAEVNRILYG